MWPDFKGDPYLQVAREKYLFYSIQTFIYLLLFIHVRLNSRSTLLYTISLLFGFGSLIKIFKVIVGVRMTYTSEVSESMAHWYMTFMIISNSMCSVAEWVFAWKYWSIA